MTDSQTTQVIGFLSEIADKEGVNEMCSTTGYNIVEALLLIGGELKRMNDRAEGVK